VKQYVVQAVRSAYCALTGAVFDGFPEDRFRQQQTCGSVRSIYAFLEKVDLLLPWHLGTYWLLYCFTVSIVHLLKCACNWLDVLTYWLMLSLLLLSYLTQHVKE